MLLTYKAILRGDRLEWREEKPGTPADHELAVIVTILDEPASPSQGARMARALEQLAATRDPGIDDPQEWERDSRRELPPLAGRSFRAARSEESKS